ncbi:Retinoic acid induced 16-like protein [Akanthomyces lecanii RCEF 1005]|uniref:Retinoic acid induced 16-like protein n=1 Tax=Akanthomyces lecanii RCEF 1005 TaxID=1081108 RepID=A0A168JI68_CORDF|nr:Retinoic acid induced 16-like protein [Akanthomyces lecanii RCEF 1005]
MDFDQAKDPSKRLHRFEKEYGSLLATWRTSSNLVRDSDAAETLEIRLQELTNILSDESRRPLPHPCIQYASIKQIYVPIGKIATTSYNEWIIKEAVLFFATLIESEEEAFVENPAFSASLTNLLVRITGVNSVRLGLDTESRVVELAFNITTKIRLDPDILPAWFKAGQAAAQFASERGQDVQDRFAGRSQRADFPLFYILMDYIHHEGKVGDFARTGLLYIIEAASNSAALEQWIVESDLSTLMATGLGALYSQLSRKLVIDHLPHDLPPILALSDYEHPTSSYEIVSSCAPEFQSHLETFLSHLLFWQDVLNHCRSVEVKSTLLEHFQVIFLQQLLYPSLLESSDIDGGSSVAVLTYLRRILESLDHPDMINLILHYLLALPDGSSSAKSAPPRPKISAARRRKSMDLATMMASKTDMTVTPILFNLVDLVLACLRSRNQQTIHVTLQLVSAILKRHHRYAIITLLKTEVLPSRTVNRTVGAHEQEIEYLMDLASSIGGYGNFDDTYQNILRDTMVRLESHPCSLKLVAPKVSTNNHRLPAIPDSLPGAPRDVREHTLRMDDPLLNSILDLLDGFFMNPVETNLSVTETIVDLAVCGYMSIEGWLARSPSTYDYGDDDEDDGNTTAGFTSTTASEADVQRAASDAPDAEEEVSSAESSEETDLLKAMERCRQRPIWNSESLPRILNMLKRLCDQVNNYKTSIPRFNELLQQRRDAFHTADSILDTPAPPPPPAPSSMAPAPIRSPMPGTPDRPSSLDEIIRTGSPSKPSALEGFAQRLLSELGTPSRSSSPRAGGKKESRSPSGTSTPCGSGASEQLPMRPPLPPKEYSPSPYAAGGHDRSISPSNGGIGVRPPHADRDGISVSQTAEYAAMDQSILAKRVGLPPEPSVKPIPLDLTYRPPPESTSDDEEEDDDDEGHFQDDDDDGDVAIAPDDSETGSVLDDGGNANVSVSHVLTNVIIFQSFLMELASLMQVRAGLFDEVRYV